MYSRYILKSKRDQKTRSKTFPGIAKAMAEQWAGKCEEVGVNMYNTIFGENPSTKEILAVLGLTELDVERFRDCWIDEDEDRIIVMARTGGMNRETWPNAKLTSNPYYIDDYDDDFDETYAYYKFVIPERDGGAENAAD